MLQHIIHNPRIRVITVQHRDSPTTIASTLLAYRIRAQFLKPEKVTAGALIKLNSPEARLSQRRVLMFMSCLTVIPDYYLC